MTTSSYKGIFSHKLSDGTIIDVQVEDPFGNSLSLPVDEYRRRGIQPLLSRCQTSTNTSPRRPRKEARWQRP